MQATAPALHTFHCPSCGYVVERLTESKLAEDKAAHLGQFRCDQRKKD